MEKIPTLKNEVKVRKQKERCYKSSSCCIQSVKKCLEREWRRHNLTLSTQSLEFDRENNSWITANLQHTIYLHTIYVYMLFSFSFLYGNTESVWINVWRSKSEERRGAKKRSVEVWGKGYSIFTRFRSTDDTRKKEMKNTYNI